MITKSLRRRIRFRRVSAKPRQAQRTHLEVSNLTKIRIHHSTDDSENEANDKNQPKKSKKERKRRLKKDNHERTFACDKCSMTYLSYPALYTHKRNKHNIIPITKKQEIFKKVEKASTHLRKKFKYSAFGESTNLRRLSYEVLNIMYEVLKEIFLCNKSVLFKPGFCMAEYSLVALIIQYMESDFIKVIVPDKDEKVDLVLITYLLLMVEVSNDREFVKNVIRFVVLLREYLNLSGWEYQEYLMDYGVIKSISPNVEFCTICNCEEIPELLNDFLEVFLKLDTSNSFRVDLKNMEDLTTNFAQWIFLNGFTNLKILPSD